MSESNRGWLFYSDTGWLIFFFPGCLIKSMNPIEVKEIFLMNFLFYMLEEYFYASAAMSCITRAHFFF